jgi:hypothetical protein
MAKGVAAAIFFALLVLLAVSLACGGGGESPAATAASTPTTASGVLALIDIKDFDTARFTTTQTSTTGENTSQLSGEGVVDNRQQALSVTYEGGEGGQLIAIGRTVYIYSEGEQRWTSVTEPTDGQIGFGRPYWPQFWLDAVDVEELGGRSQEGAEITGYRLTFDLEKVGKRLQAEAAEPRDVRQAEVEVWVDNDSRYATQLILRLEVAFGDQATRIEITSDFSDFGAEVQIEAPVVATPTPTPAQG